MEGRGMSFVERVDPELRAGLDFFPPDLLDLGDIPRMRRRFAESFAGPVPRVPGVVTEDRMVPGPQGAPVVLLRLYRPQARRGGLPALFWIHGGGYVVGQVADDDAFCMRTALAIGCLVASVGYRLAPEHPFPAPVEDCYAALRWLSANAAGLGVDPARIGVAGASAGGGLAAGLAVLARDRGEVPLCFQCPIYPMIDDRCVTHSSRTITDPRIWNARCNLLGWKAYLGREPGGDGVSPYAAASRAASLAGLPPAFIAVGDIDLFLDEDIEYAQRLAAAGVPTELHLYPGAYHGFYLVAPEAAVSRRCMRDLEDALKRGLKAEV
jgi:acetyl esterase/lipase